MINFFLGLIVGLLVAILVVVTVIYFRKVIESRIEVIRSQVELSGPRPKGYIIEPEAEAEEVRNNIIKKNKEEGKDTYFKDLI